MKIIDNWDPNGHASREGFWIFTLDTMCRKGLNHKRRNHNSVLYLIRSIYLFKQLTFN